MKKLKLLILCSLISTTSFSITYHNENVFEKLEEIKKKQLKTNFLGDFNDIKESFDAKYLIGTKNYELTNNLSIGPLTYSYSYNSNNEHKNTISLSKRLNDFIDKKNELRKYSTLSEYHTNYNKFLAEKLKIEELYTQLLEKVEILENIKITQDIINADKKIIDVKYKNGLISKIDYDYLNYEIQSKVLKVEMLNYEIENLVYQLDQNGVKVDLNNLEQISITELSEEQIKKYVDFKNNQLDDMQKYSDLDYAKKKNDINLPIVTVFASHQFETKASVLGLNVTKLFSIDGVENDKLEVSKKAETTLRYNYKSEYNKYLNLKAQYELAEKKYELAKEDLNIAEVKYSVGTISYKDLLDKRLNLNDIYLSSLKLKYQLYLFVLEREMI